MSTPARLLRTLEAGRFLRRDQHGHYRRGAQLLQLGTLALDGDHPAQRVDRPGRWVVVASFNIVGPMFRLDDDTLTSTGVPTLRMPGPCRHNCAA